MIVRVFNVTIATASVANIDSQAMHSDAENKGENEVAFSCCE